MNEINGKITGDTLEIRLSGRIDSTNAAPAEEKIRALLEDGTFRKIVIDAEDLEYISSAGLRVLLHLRKMKENLKIKNVCSDVYEIFDMTGFTQMIQIEKAYRKISIEGCEIIGGGSNGILYRIDDDTVVKVYRNQDALEEIRHEREVARTALILGIPTAISYDVVQVGEGYGSVFELLNARSFAKILASEPQKMQWCVDEYTRMLERIHETVVPEGELPDFKETVLGWTRFMKDYLPAPAYEKLLGLVQAVPRDNHMIHGDYHIENLQLQGDEVLLIDMDTLSVGYPVFELGSMFNAYVGFYEYHKNPEKTFLGIDYQTSVSFWHQFLASYLGTDDEQQIKAVEDKARILGYVRLIRRSIRRGGLEDPEKTAEIEVWKSHLLELLDSVDTLQFHRNELRIEANEEKLPIVMRFIDDHLQQAGCDPKTKKMIEMVVEEIFVNIALYAYPSKNGFARIQTRLAEEDGRKAAYFTFIDEGIPFDPLTRKDPNINAPVEEREIGGLGIFLVKKVMDEVSYEFRDGKNILTVKKYI